MGPFTADVDVTDVKKFFVVSTRRANFAKENRTVRTNFFGSLLLSIGPSHLCPAFDQPIEHIFATSKNNNRGRKRKTDIVSEWLDIAGQKIVLPSLSVGLPKGP